MAVIAERMVDGPVLGLVRQWLKARLSGVSDRLANEPPQRQGRPACGAIATGRATHQGPGYGTDRSPPHPGGSGGHDRSRQSSPPGLVRRLPRPQLLEGSRSGQDACRGAGAHATASSPQTPEPGARILRGFPMRIFLTGSWVESRPEQDGGGCKVPIHGLDSGIPAGMTTKSVPPRVINIPAATLLRERQHRGHHSNHGRGSRIHSHGTNGNQTRGGYTSRVHEGAELPGHAH